MARVRTARLSGRLGDALPSGLGSADTVRAAGLAGAALGANVLALVFTIVFARLLGASDYGSLAALLSTYIILSVPGSAMLVATARETALGRLGSGGAVAATVAHWLRRLLVITAGVALVSALARKPLASMIGVDQVWAAAAVPVTGCAWVLVSVLRGVLQGLHAYRPVGLSILGEASGRLVFGLVLYGIGGAVTGAYLGTPVSMFVAAAVLVPVLWARTGPSDHGPERFRLRSLAVETWAPVVGLTLVAILQNIDVIIVKHQVGGDLAGSYAAISVAAKAIIWVAIGLSMQLVPDTARRVREGQDPRHALVRALAIVGVLAVPALLIFAAVPEQLIRVGFGSDLTDASGALFTLGVAMVLLACTYLAVQYQLALRRRMFLILLAVGAVLEPSVLLISGVTDLETFALLVLAVQAATAAAMLLAAVRAGVPDRAAVPRPG